MEEAPVAQIDEKVMKMVEAELDKDPTASVDDLYEKAKKVSKNIGKLSLRQFNARYPLQVKRRRSLKKSAGKPRRRKSRTRKSTKQAASDGARAAVRQSFLDFASDLAAAEERPELVKVLASVDKYVDRALKAAAG